VITSSKVSSENKHFLLDDLEHGDDQQPRESKEFILDFELS